MSKTIHIVEDDEDIRYIIGYLLNELGYQVKLYETITDFRTDLKPHLPDLVILDVMLPDGNGMDLCMELKKDIKTSHIPVLIMSAHTTADEVVKATCAEDFIGKPFDLDDLIALVKKYLPA